MDFDRIVEILEGRFYGGQFFGSLLLIFLFLTFRWFLIRIIEKWHSPTIDEKRKWLVTAKNISLVLMAVSLFAIWAAELKTFAISMVALAAAAVLSLKEIIMCFTGGIYKLSTYPFDMGDRIEINGVRGEVIDHGFLSTKVMEIGPGEDAHQLTGRIVTIPNSWLLAHSLKNQSLQQSFVLHVSRLPLQPGEDWAVAEKILLDAANKECKSIIEPARHAIFSKSQREGIDLPRVEPKVTFQIHDDGKIHAVIRFPAPAARVTKTEQAILRSYLSQRENLLLHHRHPGGHHA